MIAALSALAVTIVLILAMERRALPRTRQPILRRMSVLAAMPAVVFYTTFVMVTYRPIFSAAATLIAFSGIVVANNAKFTILGEPLVFSDFTLLRQALRHPALYVRHIGLWKIIAVVAVAMLSIAGAALYEPPLNIRNHPNDFLPTLIYLATVLGLLYAIIRGPLRTTFVGLLRRFGPSTNVARDMDKLSLVVCLIFYFFLAGERDWKIRPASAEKSSGAPSDPQDVAVAGPVVPTRVQAWSPFADRHQSDIIAIQAESFFDARRLHRAIPPDLLVNYDACVAAACYSGRLTVPARGAYTMRTEFAFLSGLPNEALGYHRFNPYLNLCKTPVWTIAQLLRGFGYRTVCIHPFHANFFDRNAVIPNLGFDSFQDITSFAGAPSFGPYISDLAVAERICSLLRREDEGADDRPLFVFSITMENHGRWERDRLAAYPVDPRIEAEPLGSHELGLYLRHLCNTDAMIAKVVRELNAHPSSGVLCLYGDHLPTLPDAFKASGFEDARTDYFIWRKGGAVPQRMDTSADMLARLMLDATLATESRQAPPAVLIAE
jgi:hypothetical protein